MRKIAWISGLLIMLVFVGLGLFFPYIIFSKELDKSIGQVGKYKIEPVEIVGTNSIIDAMRSTDYYEYSFDYQEDMANMSREEVIQECNSFIKGIKPDEYGYVSPEANENNTEISCELRVLSVYNEYFEKKQKLAIDNYVTESDSGKDITNAVVGIQSDEFMYGQESDNSDEMTGNTTVSCVLWTVKIEHSADNFVELIIDDKNQKVVSMTFYSTSKEEMGYYVDKKNSSKYMSQVVIPFCEEYYDANLEIIDTEGDKNFICMTDKNNKAILLRYDVINGFVNMTTL